MEISHCRHFDAGTEIDIFPIQKFSTTRFFSMPTFMDEIKPVVLVNNEFENREKLKLKCFSFLEFSDYQDTDAREKNNDFLDEYLSTSAVLSIEILMEKSELVVAENLKFENRAKSN